MAFLFDDYLIVDWSANSSPKTGKDSIWWCYLKRTGRGQYETIIKNPSTRTLAIKKITGILAGYPGSERRVLVGFDFAYAYPKGFAGRLLDDTGGNWKSVWHYLYQAIEDDDNNANNRYDVASEINRRLSGRAAPFWGCPASRVSKYLQTKKPLADGDRQLPEFRLCEQGNSTHSVWKLYYNGSVGGQVLLGLPRLYGLITDESLASVTRVWPFDTGLRLLDEAQLQGCHILHAEIYPSYIEVHPDAGEVKDRAQVRQLASHFARLDELGELAALFAGNSHLGEEERHLVEDEEGWILGITAEVD